MLRSPARHLRAVQGDARHEHGEEQPLLATKDDGPSEKRKPWWQRWAVSPMLLAKGYYGATCASGVFLYPYIGLIMRDFGMSDSQIGLLSALRPWLGMAATMGGPILADRLGIHRAMLITGFAVSTILRSCMWLSNDMILAAALLLISDVVAAPVGPMADSIVLLGCKSEADFGRQRVWGSIGWGAVAPVAGMLVQRFGLGMAFLGFSLLSIPTLLVVAGLRYPTPHATDKQLAGSTAGGSGVAGGQDMAAAGNSNSIGTPRAAAKDDESTALHWEGGEGLEARLLPHGTPPSTQSTPTRHGISAAQGTPSDYQPPAHISSSADEHCPTRPRQGPHDSTRHAASMPGYLDAYHGGPGDDQQVVLAPHEGPAAGLLHGSASSPASSPVPRRRFGSRRGQATSAPGTATVTAEGRVPHRSPGHGSSLMTASTDMDYRHADVNWGQDHQDATAAAAGDAANLQGMGHHAGQHEVPDVLIDQQRTSSSSPSPYAAQPEQLHHRGSSGVASPNSGATQRLSSGVSHTKSPVGGAHDRLDVAPTPASSMRSPTLPGTKGGGSPQPAVSVVWGEDDAHAPDQHAGGAAGAAAGGDGSSGSTSSASFAANLQVLAAQPDVSRLLFAALAIGFGQGIIGTFLFLFAADLQASTTLMGLLLTADCVAETPVFYHQGALLSRISPTSMLHVALLAMVVRLLLYAGVPLVPGHNPWFILPIELLQGLTLAVGWSACCVLSKRLAPPGLQASLQGLMTAVFAGLGGGLGGLVGGVLLDQKLGWSATWAGAAVLVAVLWGSSAAAPLLLSLRAKAGAAYKKA